MRKKPSSRAAHVSDAIDHQEHTGIRRPPLYEIEAQAQREITEHLRGLRLARDAIDARMPDGKNQPSGGLKRGRDQAEIRVIRTDASRLAVNIPGVEAMRSRSLTEAGKGPRRKISIRAGGQLPFAHEATETGDVAKTLFAEQHWWTGTQRD